jgi:sugar phosphate isomerase/epimerase
LDPKDFFQIDKERSWNFRTIGYGHGEEFWRSFLMTLRLVGYDGVLSIESEDPLIEGEESLGIAVGFLRKILVQKPPAPLWFQASQNAVDSATS